MFSDKYHIHKHIRLRLPGFIPDINKKWFIE